MPKRNLKIGDVIIVQDEVPRNEWPLGMVIEISMNQEGLVRVVKVKLGSRNPRMEAIPNAPLSSDQYRKLFSLWKAWTRRRFNVKFGKL